MPRLVQHVQPKLAFIPQSFNPLLVHLVYMSLPILMRVRVRPWLPAGIAHIRTQNEHILAQLYQQFQVGEIRLLSSHHWPEPCQRCV